eukprot:2545640-Prymnesium_polylepis.1
MRGWIVAWPRVGSSLWHMEILSSPSVAHVAACVWHDCQSRPSWRVRAHVCPRTPAYPCEHFEPRVASSST